jgi:drug/metabolite transporter (DMT)-like permease
MAMDMSGKTIKELVLKREVSFAKSGLFIGVLGALAWGMNGIAVSMGEGFKPLATGNGFVVAVTAAAFTEVVAFIAMLIYNISTGKWREYGRSLKTRPAQFVCLGAIAGGGIALTSYMAAVNYAGPAYALPISGVYPVIGAVIAMFWLKEKISPRAWAGIALCVIGGIVLSYTPPAGGHYPMFYLGVLLAFVAAFGWGVEGAIGAFGNDTLDPTILVGIRYFSSALLYLVIILPLCHGYGMVFDVISHLNVVGFLALSGLTAVLSVMWWYISFGMIGAARANAIDSTYGLMGVILTWIFSLCGLMTFTMTPYVLIGAIVVTIGLIMVVVNPKELVHLRQVDYE